MLCFHLNSMAHSTATSSKGCNHSVQSSASTRSDSNNSNYREHLQALVENQQEGQQILQILGGQLPEGPLTPIQVREASVNDLQWHPSLWEAYIRGWQACIALICMPPALRFSNNTESTLRPIWPAGLQWPPWRQPNNTPAPSSEPRVPTPSEIQTPKTPVGQRASTVTEDNTSRRTTTAAKRKSMARLTQYRQKKRQEMRRHLQESQANTSQQFRLEKPVGLDSTPTSLEKLWNPVYQPVPTPRIIRLAVKNVPMEVEEQGGE